MNNDETTCSDCAETIKAAAKVCKHCGSRFDARQIKVEDGSEKIDHHSADNIARGGIKEWHIILGGMILVAVFATFIYITYDWLDKPQPTNLNVEAEGTAYMKRGLLDPSSVQFEELAPSAECLLGKMNAKNSFGAYTGSVDFYYDAKLKSGRVSPGLPQLGPGGAEAFDAGVEDYEAYQREQSVCLLGEEKTAQNEAAVAKRIADEKAAKLN